MRYAVIGTGAIGGYYGAKLAAAGQEVHFLLHSDFSFVLKYGLQVNSCDGSFHIDKPLVYNHVTDMPKCDVVLVGLKSVNNYLLPSLLPPLLKDDTMVILIQNGIGLEEDLQERMPHLQLVAGLAFICSSKTEPGVVNHQCYGYINLGNYSYPDQGKVDLVANHFNVAEVDAHCVEYREARWKKAVWNMPFNGMTVALDAQTDELLACPATRKLVYEQMLEVINAARACGVDNIDSTFADKMIYNTEHMTPYSPSMKLDYEFRRPMEIDYIYTRPIKMAREAGCSMPRLEMLEAELRYMQDAYCVREK